MAENLSADERQISNLLGGLEKVSAPKDFDFRLKARISAQKENGSQYSIWRTLRYVLPLTATLIIAAFVIIQGGLFSQSDKLPAVVESQNPQIPAKSDSLTANQQIAQTSNSAVDVNGIDKQIPDSYVAEPNPGNMTTAKNPSKKQNNTQPLVPPTVGSPGSKDFTVRESNVNILPEGIPQNAVPKINPTATPQIIPRSEIFNMIGIETETENGKIKVRSVKENSVAGRSGVQTGDIIEAIDEQKLDEKNLPPKFKGGKTMTVMRDGKVLEIELKPN